MRLTLNQLIEEWWISDPDRHTQPFEFTLTKQKYQLTVIYVRQICEDVIGGERSYSTNN